MKRRTCLKRKMKMNMRKGKTRGNISREHRTASSSLKFKRMKCDNREAILE